MSVCGNGVSGDNFDEIFLRLLSKSSSCFVSLDCYSRDQDFWTRSTETEPECRLTHKVRFWCYIRIHFSMEWKGIRFGLWVQIAAERTLGMCFKLSKVKKPISNICLFFGCFIFSPRCAISLVTLHLKRARKFFVFRVQGLIVYTFACIWFRVLQTEDIFLLPIDLKIK